MLEGIQLTLMIGHPVPEAAPRVVMDALQSAQVTSSRDVGGFQLTFAVGKTSPLLTRLLPGGYFDPILTRVVIVATVGGAPSVLMDGLVTRHELSPSSDPGRSTLTITGEDLTLAMDLVEVCATYPPMTDIAQVYLILAKYLAQGIVPIAVPPIFDTVKDWPAQRATDREHLRRLAADAGYVFYLEPGPGPGQSIAYFGPDVRVPVPQPALSINMDAHTNVESLSFSLDGLQKKVVVVTVLDPATKKVPIPVPIPNINILKPPLGARLTPPAKVEFPAELASLPLDQAVQTTLGYLAQSAEAVTASGTLDVARYGRVLRSRWLVGVRGASEAYDGLYYVDSVTHDIKRGEYKQRFQLSRDGLGATSRTVPV